jgi:hypothetical protein
MRSHTTGARMNASRSRAHLPAIDLPSALAPNLHAVWQLQRPCSPRPSHSKRAPFLPWKPQAPCSTCLHSMGEESPSHASGRRGVHHLVSGTHCVHITPSCSHNEQPGFRFYVVCLLSQPARMAPQGSLP